MKRISLSLCVLMLGCASSWAQSLGRRQAEAEKEKAVQAWKAEAYGRTDYIGQSNAVTRGDLTMPLNWQVFGEKPSDGYALFISLHGGGNVAAEFNDSQWKNQWRLYSPKGAVYVCPRAAYNDWDMHFKPGLDDFYHDIITYAVTHLEVNPNKVYIMGYSAGGDGVWRLAPRMADRWAAASMMAGHPGDVSLLNLRNLPFMVWCGALDAAYDRNKLCQERILQLDSLSAATPGAYIHEGHIVGGKPHWMDRVDTVAVSWMAEYKRTPYPKDIVWHQEEVLRSDFYWVSIPAAEMQRGKELRLSVKGNTITIHRCDYTSVTFALTDELVNLDKPITIVKDGRRLTKRKVKRSRETMEKWLRIKGDPTYACEAELTIQLPSL